MGDNSRVSTLTARLGVLADRDFALYCAGNAISWIGTWSQRIGVGWLSWKLSHSPSWVGLVSLLQFVPVGVCAPMFGVLLDRTDRRRYSITANAVLAALAALLFVLAVLDALTIYRLCALATLLGVANSAYQPARLALVNDIAPPGRLAEAIATNSIIYNLTRMVGPAVAGVAIVSLGIASTFAINAVSFGAVIFALTVVEIEPVSHAPQSHGFLRDIAAGIRYASGHPLIRELMLLSAVTSILGRGLLELLPAFADAVYHRGSTGLAMLTTASGAGAMLGAAALSQAGRVRGLMNALVRHGTLWLGAVLILLGAVSRYSAALAILVVYGVAIVLCSVGLQVLLQMEIEGKMRGRVLGLWGACNIAGPGIGGALLGALAQFGGLRAVTIVSGAVCSGLAAYIMRRSGRLIAVAQRP
jgi:MFS family permease